MNVSAQSCTVFYTLRKKTLERYPEKDVSLPARYARTVAFYKDGYFKKALEHIDALIADYPDDPYFYELKGQILFETGRAAEAVEPYRKAVELLQDSVLMRVGLIQAQIEKDDPDSLLRAQKELSAFANTGHEIPLIWRLQAIVYGRTGQPGLAAYALAEYNMMSGNTKQAQMFAERAVSLLPDGLPASLRAQDILYGIRDGRTGKSPVDK